MLIELWRQQGYDTDKIAHMLSTTQQNVRQIQKQGVEYIQTVEAQVEMAFLKKALGYSYDETKYIREGYDENTNETSKVKKETVTKHVAPDMNAIFAWLEHQMPERWGKIKDTEEDERSGGIVVLPEVVINKGEEDYEQ